MLFQPVLNSSVSLNNDLVKTSSQVIEVNNGYMIKNKVSYSGEHSKAIIHWQGRKIVVRNNTEKVFRTFSKVKPEVKLGKIRAFHRKELLCSGLASYYD